MDGQVFVDVEIQVSLELNEAWPDGIPETPTADKLAAEIKRDHLSLYSFLTDWDLDGSGTVMLTVVDKEGNRTYADVIY